MGQSLFKLVFKNLEMLPFQTDHVAIEGIRHRHSQHDRVHIDPETGCLVLAFTCEQTGWRDKNAKKTGQ